MDFMKDWPFPAAVATLFVVVMLRANATYWLGRAAHAGVDRTWLSRLLHSSGFHRARRLVERWGAPVIALSFLTVGFQTLANAAAGVTRMPLRRYLPAVLVGSVVWAFLYATVGFVTLAAWFRLYELSPVAAVVSLAAAVVALVAFIVVQIRGRNAADAQESDRLATHN